VETLSTSEAGGGEGGDHVVGQTDVASVRPARAARRPSPSRKVVPSAWRARRRKSCASR
jgi:hypothetical protein